MSSHKKKWSIQESRKRKFLIIAVLTTALIAVLSLSAYKLICPHCWQKTRTGSATAWRVSQFYHVDSISYEYDHIDRSSLLPIGNERILKAITNQHITNRFAPEYGIQVLNDLPETRHRDRHLHVRIGFYVGQVPVFGIFKKKIGIVTTKFERYHTQPEFKSSTHNSGAIFFGIPNDEKEFLADFREHIGLVLEPNIICPVLDFNGKHCQSRFHDS